MKRYLFASVLSFGLLVATSQFAFAQDDADDEDVEEVEETEEDEDGLTLPEPEEDEEEETDSDDDKGTRQNPYLLGEVGIVDMLTTLYFDPFSIEMSARDSDDMMAEGMPELSQEDMQLVQEEMEMAMEDGMSMNEMSRMFYPPYYNQHSLEGTGHLEFTEVLRGDDALRYLNQRNFYDYQTLDDNLEWAVIHFTFEWAESEDQNSIYVSNHEFNVFDITGVSVNANDYYTYFDGGFESNEMYVGGVLNGTIAKRVPAEEPFMIRFGDNYMFKHTFFEFDAE